MGFVQVGQVKLRRLVNRRRLDRHNRPVFLAFARSNALNSVLDQIPMPDRSEQGSRVRTDLRMLSSRCWPVAGRDRDQFIT